MSDCTMFEAARIVCRVLKTAGHDALFAGGCVRDQLLGRSQNDYDIATSATPEQVKTLFVKSIPVGERFGVIRVIIMGFEIEVATFRSDGNYSDGRRPDGVVFSTAKDDVQRRDFTINALLYDPETCSIIDYVGGERHIKDHIICTVGDPYERFREDRLRMLSALRFASQLDFTIEQHTMDAIIASSADISSVSKERITVELLKIWRATRSMKQLKPLLDSGIMQYIVPGFDRSSFEEAAERLLRLQLSDDDRCGVFWFLALGGDHDQLEKRMRCSFRLQKAMMSKIISCSDLLASIPAEERLIAGFMVKLARSKNIDMVRSCARSFFSDADERLGVLDVCATRLDEARQALRLVPSGAELLKLGYRQGEGLGRALQALSEFAVTHPASCSGDVKQLAIDLRSRYG